MRRRPCVAKAWRRALSRQQKILSLVLSNLLPFKAFLKRRADDLDRLPDDHDQETGHRKNNRAPRPS